MKEEMTVAEIEGINSVSYEALNAATSEWKGASIANNGMLGQIILPNHFEIPMIDLVELIEEIRGENSEQAVSVRAFIGVVDYDGEYNGVQHPSEMKLYLTGVNQSGNPIYYSDNQSAIYDFITPCPPTCVREGVHTGQ